MVISLIVISVVIVTVIVIYNQLVALRNGYENRFAQIDVQLKRRHDLIPNLVATAKGYLQHERETLESVIAARDQAAQQLNQLNQAVKSGAALDLNSFNQAESFLGQALGRLNVVIEDYPELKADQTMQDLSRQITHTEHEIAEARTVFNDTATAYNQYRQSFPPILVAGLLGFQQNASLLDFSAYKLDVPPNVVF